jgi:hypothetical protein
MFLQVCWWIGVVVVFAVINLLSVVLIFYGISPYTGMSFDCLYYNCDDILASVNIIAFLVSGIIIVLCISIAIVYGILKEGKTALLKLLLRHRYVHDQWYQGV